MHSNFWRVDNAKLLKFSLTSNDSCGNAYKEGRRKDEQLDYQYHTYWDGMAEGRENIALPANGYFYDELPWLVRTLDFSKAPEEFEVQLVGSIINSSKGFGTGQRQPRRRRIFQIHRVFGPVRHSRLEQPFRS
jgi:hypothetical protein